MPLEKISEVARSCPHGYDETVGYLLKDRCRAGSALNRRSMVLAVSDGRHSRSCSFLVVPKTMKVGALVSVCVRRTSCGVRLYVVDVLGSRHVAHLENDSPGLGKGASSALV